MGKEFSIDEKCIIFDKIEGFYFNRNFGSMTKTDFETFLFSEYVEHCIRNNEPHDDYTLSKELGITQSRIRALQERKGLKYPVENFDWKESFIKAVEKAKYDDKRHCVKMIVQDITVMNEVRNYVEVAGWYDECSLNKKLLVLPVDCFLEIILADEDYNRVFSKETKKMMQKQCADIKKESAVIQNFLGDFTKDGLKSFMMSASKEVLLQVLPLFPFGGLAGKALDILCNVIKRV